MEGASVNRAARTAVSAGLALMLAGCITKHVGVKSETAVWQPGVTTRLDVVRQWGNPDKMKGDTWVWRDWNLLGSKVKAAYMMIGITVANSRASTREYHLTFDQAGLLCRQEVVDSVPEGVTWSPWPWY